MWFGFVVFWYLSSLTFFEYSNLWFNLLLLWGEGEFADSLLFKCIFCPIFYVSSLWNYTYIRGHNVVQILSSTMFITHSFFFSLFFSLDNFCCPVSNSLPEAGSSLTMGPSSQLFISGTMFSFQHSHLTFSYSFHVTKFPNCSCTLFTFSIVF